MSGILYGVSVGPGEAELMTLKAARIINECDVIAVPRTKNENTIALSIAEEVCELKDKKIIYFDFLMTRDKVLLKQRHSEIADEVCGVLKNGMSVAFLNIGDISIYSTFSYIAEIVESKGYSFEIIPGVTSFCAIAAEVKRPLVQGKNPLIIMPSACEQFDELIGLNGSKVIMKSGSGISSVRDKLSEKCTDEIYAVSDCGHSTQQVYFGAEQIPDDCGYFTTIVSVSKPDNEEK